VLRVLARTYNFSPKDWWDMDIKEFYFWAEGIIDLEKENK
jgi:hypothetical protein